MAVSMHRWLVVMAVWWAIPVGVSEAVPPSPLPRDCARHERTLHAPRTGGSVEYASGWQASASPVEGYAWALSTYYDDFVRFIELDLLAGYLATTSQAGEDGPVDLRALFVSVGLELRLDARRWQSRD
jgi:hypothetical protein